ncbi:hypothetical protein Glove_29g5 [Diversispora epigaea]|uniref:Uncharacterized protein n=1 Tax=Diversispora epigaea TaxID=1348612 RepID=A0A397JM10_9GLOM|nr:hypothetical protein Glove_29g5 [Diversispora epigaea]
MALEQWETGSLDNTIHQWNTRTLGQHWITLEQWKTGSLEYWTTLDNTEILDNNGKH